ncbi:response regulator transcription factor [Amycolatopsis halotolerans]|uniref:Response regulator transcription factor n=1 Tax=Amycolatopsis halotolerans TaxID=330083 RepID=A0ABV7QG52_9PSEU
MTIREFIVSADPATVHRVAADLAKQGIGTRIIPTETLGTPQPPIIHQPPDLGLTPLRIAILQRIAEGCTDAEIAARHGVSEATTKRTVQLIYRKIGANGRAHAVLIACRAGLIRDGAT